MEFSNFFKIIKKHRFTIVLTTVLTVIITFFLVRNQPDVYSSQAKLGTGIVDQTQSVLNDMPDAQESKVSQEFSNLVEMIKSKRMLDQLAYKLIIHDLTSKNPYRKTSPLLNQLNNSARQHAIATYTELYNKRQALSLFNPDQNGLYKLLVSMHYDDQSILRTLSVYRVQNSDYINVQFDSEGSELSAVVVNTLCAEFINYYTLIIKENQKKAVDFLGNLLRVKQDTLVAKTAALKNYKIRNHVLNLNEKAKSLYGQMSDFETRREEAEKNAHATQAAIKGIDKDFDPKDRKYSESNKTAVTQKILATKAQLQAVNDAYVQSNFDPKYKRKIDSLNNAASAQIDELSDKYILNPLSTKQSLVEQKLGLQIQNDLAKNSSGPINNELNRLNRKFDALVPHEAATQALESAITIASQEYLEILQKYNQANMVSGFSIQLRLIERAEPGIAQPSKKMLLVIISGVIGFVFCIAVLFILFIFDNTIKTAPDLANRTKMPVLGYLNLLSSKSIDLKNIWTGTTATGETKQLKNLMQSLRFEVATALAADKVLLINSIEKEEGKTFVAVNLAYAYSSVNKRVLVIDGNFDNPGITAFTKTRFYLEDFLTGPFDDSFFSADAKIKFLGNHGRGASLLEIAGEDSIYGKLAILKDAFDVIIIEAPALDALNRSKEWILFADKILTVFESGNSLNENYKQNIGYLKSLNGKFIGWVLNLVPGDKPTTEIE
ncbi:exopolysaccharide transport family protein [Mucilaginibacter sp. UR6-11]|uniref:exopolysaccharide transport family protein n=1 Tax=Mucilaginibacter sp. UR6-11 TaxID=1435644 RepID=UPI001E56865D|nr:Wzz/FepE/Etk N-terminal domain-containing protein [Mucilaginibacter sp. UR6-11]MCC8423773.1 lipopolysaccharide biosynthesis protein [Mucilaginibacter sp. UR6-11]